MAEDKQKIYQQLVTEYREILTQKFKNSNQFIIDIKSAQAAYKRMQLEQAGTPVGELREILHQARQDAVCYLLMELGEFLGDQQMTRSGKATRNFLQWGIKHMISKLKDLGVEITKQEIAELTVEACLERIEKLKTVKGELKDKYEMLTSYASVPRRMI